MYFLSSILFYFFYSFSTSFLFILKNSTQILILRGLNNNTELLTGTVTNRTVTRTTIIRSNTDHLPSASTSTFSKRDGLSRQESMEVLQSMILGGKPGLDFPNYARPPRTKFSCRKMDYGGMFADPETGCQVYHVCHNRRKDTFMCPTGTLFNQAIMACDFWYNVNCESAASFYNMNEQLYHPYQNRRVLLDSPTIKRSDRPISPPVPSNSIPRPTYQVPVKPRQPPQFPPESFVPRSSFSPPTTTTITTVTFGTTTSTTTTPRPTTPLTPETPQTKKPTTPRVRVVTTTRSRSTEPRHEVDDRDWVFAWLKQTNGTRADKEILPENRGRIGGGSGSESTLIKKMGLESLPLISLTSQSTQSKRQSNNIHKNEYPLSPDLSTAKSRISLVEIRSSNSPKVPQPTPRAITTPTAAATQTVTPYSLTSSTLQQQQQQQQVTSTTTLLPPTTNAFAFKVNVTNSTSTTSGPSNKLTHSTSNYGPVNHSVNSTTTTGSLTANKSKLQSRQPVNPSSWLFPLEFMDI